MKQNTILVVDDELINLESLINAIGQTEKKYKVLRSNSAELALRILEKEIPDIIITDWDMPGMSGIELIRKVRKKNYLANIPIILYTGVMLTNEHLKTALEAGANDYIRKPVDSVELQARINSLLKYAEAQKQISSIVQNASEGIFIIQNGLIVFINPQTSTLTGFPEEQVLLRPITDFIHSENIPDLTNYFEYYTQTENPIGISIRFLHASNQYRWASANLAPITWNNKQAVLVFFSDITPQKIAEQQILQLAEELKTQAEELALRNKQLEEKKQAIQSQNKELKELVATKDKFFNIIAHDLRNPFNVIIGFSKLLLDKAKLKPHIESAQVEQFAQIINTNAQNTHKLLENLLDWARSQTGKIKFLPEKIFLKDIIQEVLYVVEGNCKAKELHLNFSYDDGLVLFVDKNMIFSVLRNLLANAVKFTNRNGSITLSALKTNNHIQISVTDNGIGIPESDIEFLFSLSKKISNQGTEGEEGTGLGLLLCKEFVEKHGGKIWAESLVGEGSVFSFIIPNNG